MRRQILLAAIALGFLGCASMGTFSPPMRNAIPDEPIAAKLGDEFITKVPLWLLSWDGFLMLNRPGNHAPEINAKEGDEEWKKYGTVRLVPKGTRVKLVHILKGGTVSDIRVRFIIEDSPELVAIVGDFYFRYDERIYDYNREVLIRANDRRIDHVVKNGRRIPVR